MDRGGSADKTDVQRDLPYPSVVSPGRAALGFVCVALAATALRPASTDYLYFGLAAATAVALVALAVLVPWDRLPTNALLLLALGCDAVVALLRESQGGATSGYAALLVLPIVWVAFIGSRRHIVVVVAALAVTLLIPIAVVGAPSYPGTGVRGAVLLGLVSAIVGFIVEYGVRLTRSQTAEEMQRSRMLDRLVQTHTAIAMSELGLDEMLRTIVEEALALTGADAAVVELPEGTDMVYRAVAGRAEPYSGLRLPQDGSASGYCLATVEPLVVPDTETDDRVNRDACREVGAGSMVIVPLIHASRPAGVLKVYAAKAGAVGANEARVLGLLGNVIGTGLARAELFATMTEHAVTDALTGLANRRSWDEQLARAIAHAERTHETLSVAVCDVNGLKDINDRCGHAAGDDLLRGIAGQWRADARAADFIARIGGDEFAIMLPGADETGAYDVVERLIRSLPDGASVSFGVAEWDLREDADDLMSRADLRMYDEKRRGKARTSSRSFR